MSPFFRHLPSWYLYFSGILAWSFEPASANTGVGVQKTDFSTIMQNFPNCFLHIFYEGDFSTAEKAIGYQDFKMSNQSFMIDQLDSEINSSISNWRRIFQRLNGNCRIQLYFIPETVSDGTPVLIRVPEGYPVLENPRFILILLLGTSKSSFLTYPTLPLQLSRLKFIPVTSKFLLILQDATYIIKLLESEIEDQLHEVKVADDGYEYESSLEFQSRISTVWNENYKDFSMNIFQSPGLFQTYFMGGFFGYNCNTLGLNFAGSDGYCFIKTLEQRLNCTAVEGPASTFAQVGNHRLDTVLTLTDLKAYDKVECMVSGNKVIPFGFLIVIDKASLEHSNPLKAFDNFTWILLSISILSMSYFAAKMSILGRDPPYSYLLSFLTLLLVHIGCLLEQGPTYFRRVDNLQKPWYQRGVFLLWLLSTIVLCGGYKGVFFSFLTSSIPPKTPATLEDLVKSEYTMVAIDSIPSPWGPPGQFINVIDISIKVYLGVTDKVQDKSQATKNRIKLYNDVLDKSILLMRLTHGKIKIIYDRQITIPHNFSMVFGNLSPTKIPKNFAVLSSEEGLDHFSRLMQISGYRYFLIRSQDYDGFISAKQMLVTTRNFFMEPVKRILAGLEEGGFLKMWAFYFGKMKLNLDAYLMACIENVLKDHEISDDLFWDYDLCAEKVEMLGLGQKTYRPALQSTVKTPKQVQIKNVQLFFVIIGAGSFIAGVIFLIESRISVRQKVFLDAKKEFESISRFILVTDGPNIPFRPPIVENQLKNLLK